MGNKSSAIKVFTYFAVVDDTGEGHPVNINVQIQEGNNRGVLKFSTEFSGEAKFFQMFVSMDIEFIKTNDYRTRAIITRF